MNILLIAPFYDKNTPGESWCTFKWVEGISERANVTVLTSHGSGWTPDGSPTKARSVINWRHRPLKGKFARLGYELKPQYIKFYFLARKWIKDSLRQGVKFDLIHQINPVALRYPSPASGLGIPYILGPHAGSLPTPQGFTDECKEGLWYRRLRDLDGYRVKYDPWLRRSLSRAEVVLGVAPYIEQFLEPARIRRFILMAETGAEIHNKTPKSLPPIERPLRLLFVGRVIRTKGILDAIRAVAIAKKSGSITLDVVGTGDLLDTCRAEAESLGIADIVRFHGRIPRSEVYEWYSRSDVFLFPSFREPSGTVVFEAMGFGLPLIVSSNGGPGYVVTPECGIRVEPGTPTQFAQDLAKAISKFTADRNLVPTLSRGAISRLEQVASWQGRVDRLFSIYTDVLNQNGLNKLPSLQDR